MMRVALVLLLAACGSPIAPPTEDTIDWPVREMRDTVIIWTPPNV